MTTRRTRYYATVPSGFETIAADGLSERLLPDVHIHDVLDGALVFESTMSAGKLADLGLFQNVFPVLRSTRKLREKAVPGLMRSFARTGVGGADRRSVPKTARSFRVVTSKENRLIRVNPELRRQVERRFSRETGLSVSRGAADVELWFLERREPRGYVLLRVTRRRATEKQLRRGELRPEVARLLCLAADPDPNDAFLDPFCGYGSIVLARLEIAPSATVRGVDSDPGKVRHLQGVLSRKTLPAGTSVHVTVGDSRTLADLADATVTVVVTDPPWGEYAADAYDIGELYPRFLRQLCRVCVPGARGVLLLHREHPVKRMIREHELPIRVRGTADVLVAGRKTTVLRLTIN